MTEINDQGTHNTSTYLNIAELPPRDRRLAEAAKKSRESTIMAAELNAKARPSRPYSRRWLVQENNRAIAQSTPNVSRRKRRELARAMMKMQMKKSV